MSEFVGSGRIVDLVLALTIAEALALLAWHRWRGRGVAPGDFLANLTSGCLLLLAMRAYAVQAAWVWVAVCLMGSGAVHAFDMLRRWR